MTSTISEQEISANKSLRVNIDKQIQLAGEQIDKCNRNIRRSKTFKKVFAMFGATTLIAQTSIAQAGSNVDLPLNVASGAMDKMGGTIIDGMVDKLGSGMLATEGMAKEDTLVWQLNEFARTTILTTQDFFATPEILQMFSTVWYIVMSFSTIILAKKGFDMIKARTMGTSSIGLGEMLIRLVSSIFITFISLDVIQLGIQGSNLLIQTLFSNFSKGVLSEEAFMTQSRMGLEYIFWLIGYVFLFGILLIRYWIRQIELIILGLIAPIASMSSVVDGGRMLGTLIKELTQVLLTPVVHGALLVTGSVLIQEVTARETGWLAFFNTIGISLATMVIMIVTPDFLRKFTHGSINPIKFALDLVMSAKAMPGRMKGVVR